MSPALPAAETTTSPALDASSAALASALSAGEKSAPSDMLITSMSLSMAHSMASVTTLVEPSQPNTRTAYRSAFGATPGPMRNVLLTCVRLSYEPVYCVPLLSTPKPALVPATWLPWPLQSSGFGSGTGTEVSSLAL